MVKKWYKSKTIWLNFFVAIIAAAQSITDVFSPVMNPHVGAILVSIFGMINMFLRSITKEKIE